MLPPFAFYALALLLWFALLALIAWLWFRSGAQGQNKLSGAAGCLISLAFGFMALLGALAIGIVALVSIPDELVRRGPIRKLEFEREAAPSAPSDPFSIETDTDAKPVRARLRIELSDGAAGPAISQEVVQLLRGIASGEIQVQAREVDGRTLLTYEFEVFDRDWRALDASLRSVEPSWALPTKAKLEIKSKDE